MSDTLTILKQARALISDEKDWCKGNYRNYLGRRCAVGALYQVHMNNNLAFSLRNNEAENALIVVVGGHVETYNDSHSHACVLEMFDVAIERLENNEH